MERLAAVTPTKPQLLLTAQNALDRGTAPRRFGHSSNSTSMATIDIRYDADKARQLQQEGLKRTDLVTMSDLQLLGRFLELAVELPRATTATKGGSAEVTPEDLRNLHELLTSGLQAGVAPESPFAPKSGAIGYGPARVSHQHRLLAAFGPQPPFVYQTLSAQKHKNKYTSDGKLMAVLLHDSLVGLNDKAQSLRLASTLEWIVNVARSPLAPDVIVRLLHELHTATLNPIDAGTAPMSRIVLSTLVDRCPDEEVRKLSIKHAAPLRAMFDVRRRVSSPARTPRVAQRFVLMCSISLLAMPVSCVCGPHCGLLHAHCAHNTDSGFSACVCVCACVVCAAQHQKSDYGIFIVTPAIHAELRQAEVIHEVVSFKEEYARGTLDNTVAYRAIIGKFNKYCCVVVVTGLAVIDDQLLKWLCEYTVSEGTRSTQLVTAADRHTQRALSGAGTPFPSAVAAHAHGCSRVATSDAPHFATRENFVLQAACCATPSLALLEVVAVARPHRLRARGPLSSLPT